MVLRDGGFLCEGAKNELGGPDMSETVLIVDEDVNASIIAETLLRVRGLEVRVATDGAEANHILEQEDVAVLVLDLSAATNGTIREQLCGRLSPPWVGATPRLVVVSDYHEPDIRGLAERFGAAKFLPKPFAPGQFISTVEGLLNSPRDGLSIS
jgi:DNA-binding response OmpR family regulator